MATRSVAINNGRLLSFARALPGFFISHVAEPQQQRVGVSLKQGRPSPPSSQPTEDHCLHPTGTSALTHLDVYKFLTHKSAVAPSDFVFRRGRLTGPFRVFRRTLTTRKTYNRRHHTASVPLSFIASLLFVVYFTAPCLAASPSNMAGTPPNTSLHNESALRASQTFSPFDLGSLGYTSRSYATADRAMRLRSAPRKRKNAWRRRGYWRWRGSCWSRCWNQ